MEHPGRLAEGVRGGEGPVHVTVPQETPRARTCHSLPSWENFLGQWWGNPAEGRPWWTSAGCPFPTEKDPSSERTVSSTELPARPASPSGHLVPTCCNPSSKPSKGCGATGSWAQVVIRDRWRVDLHSLQRKRPSRDRFLLSTEQSTYQAVRCECLNPYSKALGCNRTHSQRKHLSAKRAVKNLVGVRSFNPH